MRPGEDVPDGVDGSANDVETAQCGERLFHGVLFRPFGDDGVHLVVVRDAAAQVRITRVAHQLLAPHGAQDVVPVLIGARADHQPAVARLICVERG